MSKGLIIARPDIVEDVFKEYMDCFVKKEWVGLKNVDKVHFTFSDTMPARMKPPARPLPAAIQEAALAEFTRMCTYMFIKSNSPIASPLTIASKKTPPYVRIAANYVQVNKYIQFGQYPIPNVQRTLELMMKPVIGCLCRLYGANLSLDLY